MIGSFIGSKVWYHTDQVDPTNKVHLINLMGREHWMQLVRMGKMPGPEDSEAGKILLE